MKVLLLGRDGQVGYELARLLPGEVTALSRAQCDLADANAVRAAVRDRAPDVIVNAAAYTAVDRAEQEASAAQSVNGEAPGVLGEEARRLGAYVIHYSTDYVFDGTKGRPFVETDPTNPLQVYGRSKLAGEEALRASGADHAVLRTSWVYAGRGKNFVLTMLGKGRTLPVLKVVDDQRGAPTWARDIALLTCALVRRSERVVGLYHASASGDTTWCAFAREIFRLAGIGTEVQPIATADYPVKTPRPLYSVLDSTLLRRSAGVEIGDWRERLSAFDDLEVLRDLGRLAEHDRR